MRFVGLSINGTIWKKTINFLAWIAIMVDIITLAFRIWISVVAIFRSTIAFSCLPGFESLNK